MIEDSVIDECLNRLQIHFGSKLIVRPPATAAELAGLEEVAGTLPRDLMVFLVTCNGLRVEIDAMPRDRHLWHIHEMLHAVSETEGSAIPQGLLPVRGEIETECDFLVVDETHMRGRVVRREAFMPGATLLATTFARYVDGWSRYVTQNFDSAGHCAADHCPAFEPRYVEEIDKEISTVRQDPEIQTWFQQLGLLGGGGLDFE